MEELNIATRMYTSCADPKESAARQQRVLTSDAQGETEATAQRIINAAIETRVIQAQILEQQRLMAPV